MTRGEGIKGRKNGAAGGGERRENEKREGKKEHFLRLPTSSYLATVAELPRIRRERKGWGLGRPLKMLRQKKGGGSYSTSKKVASEKNSPHPFVWYVDPTI